ncbi:MAG: YmdB family metallophosphoesterase [Planctomycetes bacterium]|nr:YmdB family metallophosphoesterase [Planctomycetota bacterium]
MKILAIGDVVGQPGRSVICRKLPLLVKERGIHFVVANCENVAGGAGVTPKLAGRLLSYGVHALTNGDHVWRKVEIAAKMAEDRRLLRPANLAEDSPGRGWAVFEVAGEGGPARVGVLNLIGRVYMPRAECPFRAADRALKALRAEGAQAVIVDFHAEASSEKQALGRYLDGRVSAFFGTHTHVPTADEQVFPGGAGYITDVGMTGPYESIIGRLCEPVIYNFLTGLPKPFRIAESQARLCGALFDIDAETGRCRGVTRVAVDDRYRFNLPPEESREVEAPDDEPDKESHHADI